MLLMETEQVLIELRMQANFWKAQHARAVERETKLKERCHLLEATVIRQESLIKEQAKQLTELNAQIAWLKQQVFGRKTEQRKESDFDSSGFDQKYSVVSDEKRSRGQQRGTNGSGRKKRANLPTRIIFHDLPEEQKLCQKCGVAFRELSITEDSEEIHIETRLIRFIHKRKKYASNCACGDVPTIVTAPAPAKLIPKGMFSLDFWGHILAEKFLFQRPLSRILTTLQMEGLDLSQGTITGGLQKIKDMVYPLYTRILERSRSAKHWHMDETRWMMFTTTEGKAGYRWWLWVVVTKDTVAYILDPSRSAQVPKNHLGENPQGIISADRYSAYKTLLNENLQVAFCWGHVRRDFTRIYDTRRKLRPWAKEWLERINELFHLNDKRLEEILHKDKFQVRDQILRNALEIFREAYVKELKSENLHPAARSALKSLYNHWNGLLIFVDHPEIPMDNNLSERKLREPVLGRKNYYGCGSQWSGDLTAALFTIFQTARLNHLHPKRFLRAYLEACAQNQGNPPKNIDSFLPWNLSEEQKSAWKYPTGPPR